MNPSVATGSVLGPVGVSIPESQGCFSTSSQLHHVVVVGSLESHSSLGVEHSLSKRKVVGSNPACG